MQMAAYIAKFAAIFVWFVWLCSNVQIVQKSHQNLSENLWDTNRTMSRLEPRLVYMHTQKPQKLISNAR